MAFVQANLDYAAEYSRAISEAYPYLSHFGEIWGSRSSALYRPGMGKTVYIPTLEVKGAHAADRDSMTGAFTRGFNSSFTAKTLDMDREWETLVDPVDMRETDGAVVLANVTREFNQTQKIPEMDAYLASKLYSFATPDTTALTAANVLAKWDSFLESAAEARVPRDRLVAYITPAVYTLLKQAAGVTRFLSVDGPGGINRSLVSLDGVTVHQVPGDLMKSSYVFTEGWAPASGAKQINLILVDPMAVAAPVKYETVMMSEPTANSKGKYLYYERYYYGAFLLPGRAAGVIVSAAA